MSVMRLFPWLRLLAMGLLMAGAHAAPPASPGPMPINAAHVSHGRFKDLLVYRPAGTPTGFALFLSGDEGWNSTADTMARLLVQRGAMVAAIDWAKFKANLEADGDQCVFPDGDLENLNHFARRTSTSPPISLRCWWGCPPVPAWLTPCWRNAAEHVRGGIDLGLLPRFEFGEAPVQVLRARIHPRHPRPRRGSPAAQGP